MATKRKPTKRKAIDISESERYVKSIYPNAKCQPYYDTMYMILGTLIVEGYRVMLDEQDEKDTPNNLGERSVNKTEKDAWDLAAKRVNKKFLKTLKTGF